MAQTAVKPHRNRTVALACVLFVATMVGAAYAAVPLYDLFCRVTGFGGTPQVALAASPGVEVLDETVTVRFDANVAGGLPWEFEPDRRTMTVRIGEVVTAHYTIRNPTAERTVGTAVYNVTPLQTGGYFTKIQCFCFSAQPLEAGQTLTVPVVFYVDPELVSDTATRGTPVITLSYTYFPYQGDGAGGAS